MMIISIPAPLQLAFWKTAFYLEKKRHGVTAFHASLAPNTDTKTTIGKAKLYRDFTRIIRHMKESIPIPQSDIEESLRLKRTAKP